MTDLTPNQVRARGDAARVLLESPPFMEAAQHLNELLSGRVLKTTLANTETREAVFAEYDGLRRMVGQLRKWADEAAAIAQDT